MIAVLATLAALQAVPTQPSQKEFTWIAYLKLHAKELNYAEVPVAQHYAHCMSLPYFPMPEQFAAKREKCRALPDASNPSAKLRGVLDHLDSLVSDQPGSEASLMVVKE